MDRLTPFLLKQAAPFAVVGALLLPLALIHKESFVQIEVTVPEFSFEPDEFNSALVLDYPVQSLTASDFDSLSFLHGGVQSATNAASASLSVDRPRIRMGATGVPSARWPESPSSAPMSLQRVLISESASGVARATLSRTGLHSEGVKVRFAGGPTQIRLLAPPRITGECSDCIELDSGRAMPPAHYIAIADHPQVVEIARQSPSGTLDVEVIPRDPQVAILENVPIRSVRLTDYSLVTPGQPYRTNCRLSKAGKLYLPEMAKAVDIKPWTCLSFVGVSGFVLEDVLPGRDNFKISMSGRVSSLMMGSHLFQQEQLPSWLEWLHARNDWRLYCAIVASFAATLVAVRTKFFETKPSPFRRIRRPNER